MRLPNYLTVIFYEYPGAKTEPTLMTGDPWMKLNQQGLPIDFTPKRSPF
jgi:hypothetical protein